MMEPINNLFASISAYADMSPDLSIRREVNQRLKISSRDELELSSWCRLYSDRAGDRPVLAFIYQQVAEYSGLSFGRVRPSDRLVKDLHLPLVCWFDWVLTFCEDFFQQFDVDLSDCFDEDNFETVDDMIAFLLKQVKSSSTVVTTGSLPALTAERVPVAVR